jgi:hypothetical protein
MNTPTLLAPIVNLNGSSRADLFEQYRAVLHAAYDLRKAMTSCVPHGRDYPMSPVDAGLAREAHFEFYRIITDLENQYTNIAIALNRGEDQ